MLPLNIKILRPTQVPAYTREGDAALDLRACLDAPLTLQPGERADINSGIAVAIPIGHVGLIFPRGGQGRQGLTLANTTGVIDSNYRGEIFLPVVNTGLNPITIEPQQRIMQLAVVPVPALHIHVVNELDETNRGTGHYTSSGTH